MKTSFLTAAAKTVAALCVTAAATYAGSVNAATYVITNGSVLNASFTVDDSTMIINAISGQFRGSNITGVVVNPYASATGYYSLSTQMVQATRPTGSSYSFDNIFNGYTFNGQGLLFRTSTDVANVYASNGSILIDYAPFGTTAFNPVPGTTTVTLQAAAVPEPATWAMLTLGFGAMGFAMRRKKVSTRVRFA